MALCGDDSVCTVVFMAEGKRAASAFTRHVVDAINGFASWRRIKTNQALADAVKIPLWKITRINAYQAPITLDELELFAAGLNVSAGEILDKALELYGGLDLLVSDLRPGMSEGSPENEVPAKVVRMFPQTEEDLEVVERRGRKLAAETGPDEARIMGGEPDEGSAPSGSGDESDGSPRTS